MTGMSLKTRILAVFLLALVAISGMTLWFSWFYDRSEQRERARDDLLLHANVYQQSLGKLLERNDFDGIAETIALQGANVPVQHAAFVDDTLTVLSGIHIADRGKPLADLMPAADHAVLEGLSRAMQQDRKMRLWPSQDGNSLLLLLPLYQSRPEQVAVGETRQYYYFQQYGLDWITAKAWSNLLPKTLPILVLIALLLAALFVLLNRLLTDRLVRLSNDAGSFVIGTSQPRFDDGSHDEIGQLGRVLSSLMARIAAEQHELLLQNRRLAYIQHTARLGSFGFHPQENSLELSEELCLILGLDGERRRLPLQELLGCVHADDVPSVAPVFRLQTATLAKSEVSFRFRRHGSGEQRYGYLTFSPRLGDEAGADHFLGSIMDVTPLKTAEESLRHHLQLNQKIIDNMVEAIFTINTAGEIELVNKAAVVLFEYPRHQLRTKALAELLDLPGTTGTGAALFDGLRELTRGHSGAVQLDATGRRSTGAHFPARVTLTRLVSAQGHADTRFILTCSDQTQQIEQQQQLALNEKMVAIGQLSSGIAHDFNNILGVVMGYAELLKGLLQDRPDAQPGLDEILKASLRARTLTDNLLSYSRSRSAGRETCDIRQLLERASSMLKVMPMRNVTLTLDPPPAAAPVELDPNGFLDVVLNLGINAIHAMQAGGELTIRAESATLDAQEAKTYGMTEGDYVVLTIADTGTGMDDATLKRIFEPFFSTKGKGGTGLGLAQVYHYVQRNDGGIKVSSQPGVGTLFTLAFPLRRA